MQPSTHATNHSNSHKSFGTCSFLSSCSAKPPDSADPGCIYIHYIFIIYITQIYILYPDIYYTNELSMPPNYAHVVFADLSHKPPASCYILGNHMSLHTDTVPLIDNFIFFMWKMFQKCLSQEIRIFNASS